MRQRRVVERQRMLGRDADHLARLRQRVRHVAAARVIVMEQELAAQLRRQLVERAGKCALVRARLALGLHRHVVQGRVLFDPGDRRPLRVGQSHAERPVAAVVLRALDEDAVPARGERDRHDDVVGRLVRRPLLRDDQAPVDPHAHAGGGRHANLQVGVLWQANMRKQICEGPRLRRDVIVEVHHARAIDRGDVAPADRHEDALHLGVEVDPLLRRLAREKAAALIVVERAEDLPPVEVAEHRREALRLGEGLALREQANGVAGSVDARLVARVDLGQAGQQADARVRLAHGEVRSERAVQVELRQRAREIGRRLHPVQPHLVRALVQLRHLGGHLVQRRARRVALEQAR
ncbi:MAG: hypothetical protein K8H88_29980 [Sandaracinaceae bacterium]|nr:hypothetical protein [Sandaracinaceae bacterium]